MADDEIRYDLLTQDALRGVVRQVLARVQREGLPGEHHLYIAFDTGADGVSVSKRLKEQYPEEMTIVLQYQFWDLQVSNDRFEVKLSFSNVPERLVVPFSAVKAFYDPSAQFGLQFGRALRAAGALPQPREKETGCLDSRVACEQGRFEFLEQRRLNRTAAEQAGQPQACLREPSIEAA